MRRQQLNESPNLSPKGSNPQNGAFPDFHHKMSKKIAQLTKVIYHLNTKNDDHEFQLRSLADTYESEIEEILQDTSRKINHFRDLLEKKKNDGKIEEAIKTMSAIHNREKMKALEEFESFKRQTRVREAHIHQETEEKVKKLTNELDTVKNEFQRQLANLTHLSQQIEQSKSNENSSLREVHAREIEDLVQQYNKKYNEMLTHMMNENDETEKRMKLEFEKQLEQYKNEEAKRCQALLEEETRKRKAALEAQQKELFSSQNESNSKIYELNEELNRLREVESTLNAKLAKQLLDLSFKDDHIARQDSIINDMQSNLSKLHKSNHDYIVNLDECRLRTQTLTEQLEDANKQIRQMKDVMKSSNSSEMELKNMCSKLQTTLDEKNAELSILKNNSVKTQEELSGQQNTINKLETQLQDSRTLIDELQNSEKRLKLELHDLIEQRECDRDQSSSKHMLEVEKIKQLHESQLKEKESQYARELEEYTSIAHVKLAQREAELKSEFELEKKELIEKHNAVIHRMANQFENAEQELENLRRELQLVNNNSQKGQHELQQQITNLCNEKAILIQDMNNQVLQLKHEHEEQMKQVTESLSLAEKQNKSLVQQLEMLNSQISELNNKSQEYQTTIDTLNIKISEMMRKAQEDMETVLHSNEQGLSKLRRQIEQEWEDKLNHELNKQKLQMQSMFDNERAEIVRNLNWNAEREKQNLENTLRANIAALEEALSTNSSGLEKSSKEIMDLKQKLQEEQENNKKILQDMSETYRRDINNLISNHVSELQLQKTELQKNYELLSQTKDQLHAKYVEDLKLLHDQEKTRLIESQRVAMERRAIELDNQRLSDLKQLDERKTREAEEAIKQLKTHQSNILHSIEQEYNTRRSELLQDISRLNQYVRDRDAQIESLKAKRDDLQESLNKSMADYRAKCEELLEQRRELLEESKKKQKSLMDDHKIQINQLIEEHLSETQLLNNEFNTNQLKMQEVVANLQKKIEEWELRYKNRESRPEDVERIRLLEREIIEKENLLQKAVADMKYFKLELLNREENYNKTFGRQPNVGLINPLNAKTSNSVKGSLSGNSSSSSRLPPLNGTFK